MTIEEIQQFLQQATRIADALERSNTLNAEWIAYQKEQDRTRKASQDVVDVFRGRHYILLMDTLDKCCERVAVPKPDWWGRAQIKEKEKEEKEA